MLAEVIITTSTILWCVGSVVGCVGSVVVAGIIARKIKRWFITDPHKDVVIFLGPKESGKTELLAVLEGRPFEERINTGAQFNPQKECTIGEKSFVVLDSGGEGRNIRPFVTNIIDYVSRKETQYVLIVLVTDISKLHNVPETSNARAYSNKVQEASDVLAKYIGQFTRELESNNSKYVQDVYQRGKWGYTIIGTHAKNQKEKSSTFFSDVATAIEESPMTINGSSIKAIGKMRRLDKSCKELCLVELSENEDRQKAIEWIKKMLENLHK